MKYQSLFATSSYLSLLQYATILSVVTDLPSMPSIYHEWNTGVELKKKIPLLDWSILRTYVLYVCVCIYIFVDLSVSLANYIIVVIVIFYCYSVTLLLLLLLPLPLPYIVLLDAGVSEHII